APCPAPWRVPWMTQPGVTVAESFLIVGGGLAGMLLARALRAYGLPVLLVDDEHPQAASRVAAGLVNPLAGMRFNPPPGIAAWLEAARRTYEQVEAERGAAVFHPLPMYRLFRSEQQIRFHTRRLEDLPEHLHPQGLFGPRLPAGELAFSSDGTGIRVRAPHGAFEQASTGWLQVNALLEHERERLRLADALVLDHFDPEELSIRDRRGAAPRWRGERLAGVIFCEGHRGRENRWFADLPWAPDKGELLTVRLERHDSPAVGDAPADRARIVNGAHWLIPLGGNRYRFGATHEHHRIDTVPTESARRELLAGLRRMLASSSSFSVIDHRAGVRPATADRRPFMGAHPRRPWMMIFNGFGARGSLSIPYHAERMADWIARAKPLPETARLDLRWRHAVSGR
ncbi:MAG: FAD-binding oxidoreductase, partial [Gammaproteobacteria bacterium]|nr:FAD-binding oxidoreductase [Gammaproteobacteria bacterium]